MSGRSFTVSMVDQTIVADATLILLRSASSGAGAVLEVLRAGISQHGTATSQQLGARLSRKVTAFGTYTSATPTPHSPGGDASAITGSTSGAAGSAGVDASAEGAGAATDILEEGFNNLNGWLWVPTPEERIILAVGEALALRIHGTPTTLTNWHAYLTYRELT